MKDACSIVAYARPGDTILFAVYHERFAVKTGVSTHFMCSAKVQVSALPVESKAKASELVLTAPNRNADFSLGSLFVAAFANPSIPSSNPFDGPMSDHDVNTLSRIPPRWAQRMLNMAQDNFSMLSAWRDYSAQWTESFKSSQLKSDFTLGCLPTNLHQAEFCVRGKETNQYFATTTIGATAAHSIGLRFEGLAQLQSMASKVFF